MVRILTFCLKQRQPADLSPDPRMRQIGRSNCENIVQLLRSLALYPLTQRLHMSTATFDSLVAQAQEEARNHDLKPYFPLYVSPRENRAQDF